MILDKLKFFESKAALTKAIISGSNDTCVVSTINPNVLKYMYIDEGYREIIGKSDICVCDGTAVLIFNNIISRKKTFLYPGPDLFHEMLSPEFRHLFIGSTEEILFGLKENLSQLSDEFSESIFMPLPFLDVTEFDYERIANEINAANPDFIWVSLGAPKQDAFMHMLKQHLSRGVMVGVGAAFRFYSGVGKSRRAPKLLRRLHLEWLFRLLDEPKKTSVRIFYNLYYLPLIFIKEILNTDE